MATEKKKPNPAERARLAANKRRAAEREVRRAARSKRFDYGTYFAILLGVVTVWSVFLFRAIQPPPPLPIGVATAPRIQLKDGRHVAFHERGASAEDSKHSVLVIHGYRGSRLDLLPNITDDELIQLGIRLVSYDRAGYGQSDPFPGRNGISESHDIDELADLLGLGSRFYVVGVSWGALPAWACLRFIPHRLKGVALISPVSNYWAETMKEVETYDSWMWLVNSDRISILLSRHMPWLLHFWMSQKLVRRGAWGGKGSVPRVGEADQEILSWPEVQEIFATSNAESDRQGPVESVYRDMQASFQNWKFDISEINLDGEDEAGFQGEVHLWQGSDDWICPAPSNRYVNRVQPLVNYNELEGKGHLFFFEKGWSARILRELIVAPPNVDPEPVPASTSGSCTSEDGDSVEQCRSDFT